jgi:hypothetical protein
MARKRTNNRIATVKRGKSANPILSDWVADNLALIVEDNGCDFDSDDKQVFVRSGQKTPISTICRMILESGGPELSGDTERPESEPVGFTESDGRTFYGLRLKNKHKPVETTETN